MTKPVNEDVALADERAELQRELAELKAKNEAATGWGAAVGARSERIKEIERKLSVPPAQSSPPTSGALAEGASEILASDRNDQSLAKGGSSNLPSGATPQGIRWQRVNGEAFEYAIQQGPHGDEFVKLLDGSCLRRAISASFPQSGQMSAGTPEALERIDVRLADLREANEIFRKSTWDRGGDIQRNDREIRWLIDTRFILASPRSPGATDAMVERGLAENIDLIQGFTYEDHHAIRDFRQDYAKGVEIWRTHAPNPVAFHSRLAFEKLKAQLSAALAAPSQEVRS